MQIDSSKISKPNKSLDNYLFILYLVYGFSEYDLIDIYEIGLLSHQSNIDKIKNPERLNVIYYDMVHMQLQFYGNFMTQNFLCTRRIQFMNSIRSIIMSNKCFKIFRAIFTKLYALQLGENIAVFVTILLIL